MKRNRDFILAGVAGTTAMSVYSYALSLIRKKDFREPELLAKLFRISKAQSWLIHYGVGIFFSGIYTVIWRKEGVSPLRSSILFGLVTGLIAVGGWKATFRLHPGRAFNTGEFYLQLVLAHFVFCMMTAVVYEGRGAASFGLFVLTLLVTFTSDY
ncbi:MAG: hypothetical protein ACJ77K_00390 [Bacteroidia bacterium]|jgi:hypothetical protein